MTGSVAERPLARLPSAAPVVRSGASALRRHGGLAALLVAGAALRALALVAIYPGIWFSDSNGYVQTAATGTLGVAHVDGYSLFVAPFWRAGSAGALIAVQHVLGLGIVGVLYALLVRRGVPAWLAALGVAPAALDAYVIDIEHMVMSETVFHAAVVGGIALLLWPARPRPPCAAGAGLLLGYAAVVRSVGAPFAALVLAYLLLRRAGPRPVAAFVVCWAIVAAAYAAQFDVQHGRFAFTGYGGRYLYAQVAPFADCAQLPALPAGERRLCPDPRRRLTRNGYLWSRRTPIHGLPLSADGRIHDFALRVIEHEPGRYAQLVAGSLLHYLEPGHHTGRDDYDVATWQFPADPRHWSFPGYRGPIRPASDPAHPGVTPNRYVGAFAARPRTDVTASGLLHAYQRFAYSSGQVLTPCLALVAIALLLRRGSRRLRADAALLAAAALTALLVASALSLFDYRYELLAVILLPPAAALGGASFLRPRVWTPALRAA